MASAVANLLIKITGDTKQARSNIRGMEKSLMKLGSAVGLIGIGAFLKECSTAAMEAEKAQVKLAKTVENAGYSWSKYGAQIDASIQKTSELAAIDDEKLSDALNRIVQVTGNVTDSMQIMNIAADVSRGTGKDLETVSVALARAYEGQTGALKRLGIIVDKDSKGMTVLDEVSRRFGGQAKAYGDTAAGSMERLQVKYENLQETIGKKLLPAQVKLGEAASRAIDAFNKLSPAMQDFALTAGVGGTAAASFGEQLGGAKGAVTGWAGTVGFAIGTLVTKTKEFAIANNLVQRSAERVAKGELNIKDAAVMLFSGGYGPLAVATQLVLNRQSSLNRAVAFARGTFSALRSIVNSVSGAYRSIQSRQSSLLEGLTRVGTTLNRVIPGWRNLATAINGAYNAITKFLSKAAKAVGLDLPGFAGGGTAVGPSTGYPVMLHGMEQVIPLGDRAAGLRNLKVAAAALNVAVTPVVSSGGSSTVFNISGSRHDADFIATSVKAALSQSLSSVPSMG